MANADDAGMVNVVDVVAPLAGLVFKIVVSPGQEVANGSEVVILESMKMQIPVPAHASGRVNEVCVQEGNDVDAGDVLVRIEPAREEAR